MCGRFTPEYQAFCEAHHGRYLHHCPRTSRTPLDPDGRRRFVEAYEAAFGSLHPLWQADEADRKKDCGCKKDEFEGQ